MQWDQEKLLSTSATRFVGSLCVAAIPALQIVLAFARYPMESSRKQYIFDHV